MSHRLFGLFALVPLLVLLVALPGCGGGVSKEAGYAGAAPGAPGVMMEQEYAGDEAPPPAPPEPSDAPMADRAEVGTTSATGRSFGGQAPAPARAPSPEKKAAEREVRATEVVPQGPAPKPEGPKPPATQLLVYTADLRVAVRDVRASIDAVEKAAVKRGGYLVSREDNRITIRVPSAEFDAALNELAKLGELLQRNVSVQDVTDLYFDLEVRVKNLEIVKKRLEELLAKASTVSEALAVQRQLERVSSELESLRGRLKLLRELILFSTITVVFQPLGTENLKPGTRLPFPWMDQLGLGSLLRLN